MDQRRQWSLITRGFKTTGLIVVSFKVEGNNQLITIKDDGPGIKREMQQKVFEMFQTLKPRDEVEASGMGLAIVYRILKQYHAKIHIESDGKSGTSFVIRWPVNQ